MCVPSFLCIPGSVRPSDPQERAHFWLPETTSETPENLLTSPIAERMYIEKDEVLRVRVETDEFYDDEPGPPVIIDGQKMEKIEGKRRAPYTIVVCLLPVRRESQLMVIHSVQ